MDAGWEIEVTRYSSGKAIVAPEIWYAAIPDREAAKASVEASASDPVGPLALAVKRSVRAKDLTAKSVVAGKVWNGRKGAVMGTQSTF